MRQLCGSNYVSVCPQCKWFPAAATIVAREATGGDRVEDVVLTHQMINKRVGAAVDKSDQMYGKHDEKEVGLT